MKPSHDHSRLYPWGYIKKLLDIVEEGKSEERPLCQERESASWRMSGLKAGSEVPMTSLYCGLKWDDLWDDAEALNVVRYLRESKRVNIPQVWKDILLQGLV